MHLMSQASHLRARKWELRDHSEKMLEHLKCNICHYSDYTITVHSDTLSVIFSCPEQPNRWPCPSLALSDQTNNQSFHNNREQGWAGIPVPGHSREYRPPVPVPENWEWFFHSRSRSQKLGMLFFIPVPVPKIWDCNFQFPFPLPGMDYQSRE